MEWSRGRICLCTDSSVWGYLTERMSVCETSFRGWSGVEGACVFVLIVVYGDTLLSVTKHMFVMGRYVLFERSLMASSNKKKLYL